MLDIYNEFRQLVTALAKHNLDYALCGGMAMAVHQSPRATIDIDILIPAEALELRGWRGIKLLEEGERDAES
jgi:hypothetical protein